jgi:hypothetical protein
MKPVTRGREVEQKKTKQIQGLSRLTRSMSSLILPTRLSSQMAPTQRSRLKTLNDTVLAAKVY